MAHLRFLCHFKSHIKIPFLFFFRTKENFHTPNNHLLPSSFVTPTNHHLSPSKTRLPTHEASSRFLLPLFTSLLLAGPNTLDQGPTPQSQAHRSPLYIPAIFTFYALYFLSQGSTPGRTLPSLDTQRLSTHKKAEALPFYEKPLKTREVSSISTAE